MAAASLDGAPGEGEAGLVRLMVEYQAGRVEAFEEIYRLLAGDLLRHLQASSRDGVAHDLLQETFLEIHRSRRTYLPPLPVRPWVFGVARNVVRRHRRTAWRRARHEEPASADRLDGSVPLRSAAAARPAALSGGDVDQALASVAAPRRRVWELHHLHGFSFEEISRMLGIPVGAAKLRSSRAMGTLREFLGIEKRGRRG